MLSQPAIVFYSLGTAFRLSRFSFIITVQQKAITSAHDVAY